MAPKGRWGKKDSKVQENKSTRPVLDVRRTVHNLPDAICVQLENYYTIEECEKYIEVLKNEIDWRRQEIHVSRLDGSVVDGIEPRLTLFMSDEGICYEYSRRDNVGVGWHPAIQEIKKKAERALFEHCGHEPVVFNSAQLNRYEGPRHALGMHADNEPDLKKGAPIVSVSFGATREFRIMRRSDESQNWMLSLSDGCFLLMGGDMQTHYLHGVPAGGERSTRINITFRVCNPRPPKEELRAAEAAEEGAAFNKTVVDSSAVPGSSAAPGNGGLSRLRKKERSAATATDECNRTTGKDVSGAGTGAWDD